MARKGQNDKARASMPATSGVQVIPRPEKSGAPRILRTLDGSKETSRAPGRIRKVREGADCQIINSLARGLKVLSAFGPEDATLTNKDFAVRVGLPKPTVSRLTNTLARLNFLVKVPETGAYRLGEATLALGLAASSQMDLPYIARPFLREFAEQHGLGVSLGVRDGLEIRSLAYVVSEIYDEAEGEAGTHLALFARQGLGISSSGFALLSAMTPPERMALFDSLADWHGESAWPNLQRRIEFAIEDVARYGFCISMREWDRRLNSVATPLISPAGGLPMSLACVGPSAVVPESRLRNTIAPALLQLKSKIITAHGNLSRS